jgi:UPF0755 protein
MHKKIRIVAIGGIALLLCKLLVIYALFVRPNILVNQPSQQLKIPHGVSFAELKTILCQQGYLAHPASFGLVARLLCYDRRIIPGAYQLKGNMSNWAAIRMLRRGAQKPVHVVFNNIQTKEALAERLTQNIEMGAADFLGLLNDAPFVEQYGFSVENVMTLFIPNTYQVYWTITPKELFAKMHQEYQRFWNRRRRSQAKSTQLTPMEVSILASIVQRETNKIDEAALMAGVYINRLRKKIALQSCPTLLYALGDPSARRVLHKYKALESPYNTYKYSGLPPGPICLPSVAMIDAVLNYAASDYFYFSAKEDFSGYHYFTRSLKEHLRNAKRYQKALNQARVYR